MSTKSEQGERGISDYQEVSEVLDTVKENSIVKACLAELRENEGSLCLRFASGDGGHFIHFTNGSGFTAVYSGPHGPENRPTSISRENILRLFEMSENIELVNIDESPYAT